jgi:hypothetical protein
VRVRERDGTLEVEDVPGMHWLLGLLFVGVGGLFVAGPLGLFTDAGRLQWWVRASVRLECLGLGGRAVQEWPLAALTAVQLVEARDDEGGAVLQLHLHLGEARPVPLSPVWRHDRARMEHVALRLAAAAGARPINVQAPSV